MDMDMFYAAVEMRDQPDLVDKPMAVGGMGMLSTSNYRVPNTICMPYYFFFLSGWGEGGWGMRGEGSTVANLTSA